MDELREKFLRAYSNIPLSLRDEIILVLDQKIKLTGTTVKDSITWRVAYLEVLQNTELGQQILKELSELDLI